MSQRFLEGQSPPLFHYGQQYQGTLEALPLSFSLLFSDTPAKGLHNLPILWGILFILITTYSFWKYGNSKIAAFVFLILCLGGVHFHWIISKEWFGYTFSLFTGSLLWLISMNALKRNRLTTGCAVLWGSIAGISFYQLPLCLPFILGSGCIFIPLFLNSLLSIQDFSLSIKRISRKILLSLYQSNLIYACFFFVLFSFPYWISPFLEMNTEALGFLTKGRALTQPRVPGENPLIDRFLSECLPVLLGNRSPYNHLSDLPSSFFPYFSSLFFFISVCLFPFVSKSTFPLISLLHTRTFRYSSCIFAFATIFFVSYSPFGIWPWYAISLYWIIPLLFYTALSFLWKYSPALSFSFFSILLLSSYSSFYDYNPMFHQPSSLSLQGHWTPTSFESIKDILKKENIRFLLCDQGFDRNASDAGRDWIGECLLFDGNSSFISVSRLSRRVPDLSQETINASRVGYLFHKNFYFNNPIAGDSPSHYSPIQLKNISALFGEKFLQYKMYSIDPYVLFIPRQKDSGFQKDQWNLNASNPIFLSSTVDNNLCLRGIGSEAYWASDNIPNNGCVFRINFNNPKEFQNIILFHGTKYFDRIKNGRVKITLDTGFTYDAGIFKYDSSIRSSVLNLYAPVVCNQIEITVQPNKDKSWLTIYEIWIY